MGLTSMIDHRKNVKIFSTVLVSTCSMVRVHVAVIQLDHTRKNVKNLVVDANVNQMSSVDNVTNVRRATMDLVPKVVRLVIVTVLVQLTIIVIKQLVNVNVIQIHTDEYAINVKLDSGISQAVKSVNVTDTHKPVINSMVNVWIVLISQTDEIVNVVSKDSMETHCLEVKLDAVHAVVQIQLLQDTPILITVNWIHVQMT